MTEEKSLRKLLFSISTLEDLREVLSSRSHFQENIRMSLFSLMGSMPVSKGAIFLYNRRRRGLVLEACRGAGLPEDLRIPLSSATAEALRRQDRIILVARPPRGISAFMSEASAVLNMAQAVLLVPLKFGDGLEGLISLGPRFNGEAYTESDLEILKVLANYIAIGIHNQGLMRNLERTNRKLRKQVAENQQLYVNLESIYNDTIRALGTAIDAKDPYTRGHSERVAMYSMAIAVRLGLSENEVSAVRIASHLHDIGKIAIDNQILLKPGSLDDMEKGEIARHPTISFDILSNIKFPYPDVALITRHHHEWVNGDGYPDQLAVEKMNTGMKIIGLADAFDAMTSDRPYRSALDLEVALERIKEGVYKQFDGQVAQTFFKVLYDEVRGEETEQMIISNLKSGFAPQELMDYLEKIDGGIGIDRRERSVNV